MRLLNQWEWGTPVPQRPQELDTPEQEGPALLCPVTFEAKVESFFDSFFEPHAGQEVPSQLLERTRISLSCSHCAQ